jgi:hypothetical protein
MNPSTEPHQHLDLDQLLAEVTGEPNPAPTSDHLASCSACQSELSRWTRTFAGTQRLMAITELPPWRFPAGTATRRPGRRALGDRGAGRGHRVGQ